MTRADKFHHKPSLGVAALAVSFFVLGGPGSMPAAAAEIEHKVATGETRTAPIARPLPNRALTFVRNEGQANAKVQYLARGPSQTIYVTQDEVVFVFVGDGDQAQKGPISASLSFDRRGVALALRFVGANPNAIPEAEKETPAKVSYFRGNDPTKWQRGLSTYRQIVYRDLWPGIDLILRGGNGHLKYEFVVQPGAKPEAIRLAYSGVEGLSLDRAGNLLIATAIGILTDTAPVSWQEMSDRQVAVASRFVLHEEGGGTPSYGFAIGSEYNIHHPLIIDPGLVYSTFFGGSGDDRAGAGTVENGYVYLTGMTTSADLPTTLGAFDTGINGDRDVFVAKLSADGSSLVYSTYLGGGAEDYSLGIAVENGHVYVTGPTLSANFPTTPGSFDATHNGGGSDAFITKLSVDGASLVYSTFLGGTGPFGDYGGAITVEGGNAYVTGGTSSADFPATPVAYDDTFNGGNQDAFVAKFSVDGSTLVYSTFLGGGAFDEGVGITVKDGNAYVTGQTSSANFPATPDAFDTALNGIFDAFIAKISPDGSALVYSTFLGGGSSDTGIGIAVEGGEAYVVGVTESVNFPTTVGAFDTGFGGWRDAFVAKLSANGSSLVYSTYLGGGAFDSGLGIAVVGGVAYVAGVTSSADFPTTSGAYDETYNGPGGVELGDVFVASLNPDGSALLYSTFLGGASEEIGQGIAIENGNVFVVGVTQSTGFPTTAGAFDTSFNGVRDAFAVRMRGNRQLSCVGFEPPMDKDAVKVRRHRALPLKATLTDDSDNVVTNLDVSAPPVLQVAYDDTGGGGAVDVTSQALPLGLGTEGSQFSFVDGGWQYNLATTDYSATGMYTIKLVSGSALEYWVNPECTATFVVE